MDRRHFLNDQNRSQYVDQLLRQSPYVIFCYWEDVHKSNENTVIFYSSQQSCLTKNYLPLCKQSLYLANAQDFLIVYLDQYTIQNYLTAKDIYPFTFDNLNEYFPSIPQKTDFLRLILLYKYGGIWCDADIIFFKSMKPFVEMLEFYDYVGFGCYYNDCQSRDDGYGYPANWVMMSRQHGKLITEALNELKRMIRINPKIAELDYHCFGKELLKNMIEKLRKNKNYTYYHVSSKCIERDSNGYKWTNSRMMSDEDIDQKCDNELFFIPIYNTAPGFPDRFLKLSTNEILQQNFLISKLFRKALITNK